MLLRSKRPYELRQVVRLKHRCVAQQVRSRIHCEDLEARLQAPEIIVTRSDALLRCAFESSLRGATNVPVETSLRAAGCPPERSLRGATNVPVETSLRDAGWPPETSARAGTGCLDEISLRVTTTTCPPTVSTRGGVVPLSSQLFQHCAKYLALR